MISARCKAIRIGAPELAHASWCSGFLEFMALVPNRSDLVQEANGLPQWPEEEQKTMYGPIPSLRVGALLLTGSILVYRNGGSFNA